MDKVIGLCVIYKKKLMGGGGTVRFIGENLGRVKGLKHLIIFSLLQVCFLTMEFQWV